MRHYVWTVLIICFPELALHHNVHPETKSNHTHEVARRDMVLIRGVKRADAKTLNELVSTADDRQQLLNELRDDYYSTGSVSSRKAQAGTWGRYHRNWFGDSVPTLPHTYEKMEAVGACFKKTGYRRCHNCLNKMKDQHVLEGHPWSDQLAKIATHCSQCQARSGPYHGRRWQ